VPSTARPLSALLREAMPMHRLPALLARAQRLLAGERDLRR